MMACKVEKFQSVGKGNGLRATVSVSAGEELYVAEPFAYTIKDTNHGKVCEYCLNAKKQLLQCTECKYAKYCSKPCQEKAWPDHKRECKCLESVRANNDIDTVRLAIQVIFKVLQNSPCASENLYSVADLECKPKDQRPKLKEAFEIVAGKINNYLKEEITDPLELPADLTLSELIAKVSCNRFPILNDSLLEAGVGVYPSMCLLNHSCEPNCTVVFMGRLLHLRAIRNIEAGEELTITYITLMMPTEERKSRLRTSYCFECDCRRCQAHEMDDHMLAGDAEASDKSGIIGMMVDTLQTKNQWEESLKLCKSQLKENVGRVPDENICQLKLLYSAVKACIALGRPKEGLRYANRALKPYRLYTSGLNYAVAMLLIKIGKMQLAAGQINRTVKTLTEAHDIFMIFLGKDHPLTKELMQTLQ